MLGFQPDPAPPPAVVAQTEVNATAVPAASGTRGGWADLGRYTFLKGRENVLCFAPERWEILGHKEFLCY